MTEVQYVVLVDINNMKVSAKANLPVDIWTIISLENKTAPLIFSQSQHKWI